ncbi:polyprenol dehydrogenase-like [Dermacentor andersoni]|uniref:polyprenol dehydrogenase-like n=1 Tax=Dermacentor andersoni TaxID=34620 RepID=UPI003B3ABF4F
MILHWLECAAFHIETWFKIHLIAAEYFFKECAQRFKSVYSLPAPKTYCSVDKKTAVVTGGTQGLGLETVRALLALNARVIVGKFRTFTYMNSCVCTYILHECKIFSGSSSPVRSLNTKKCLEEDIPGCEVEILPLDLRSMSSVDNFAQEILRRNVVVDILICGAGVMFNPYQETEDGFESHLSINYLGHCLLTALLLPRLISAGTPKRMARIVNVSSCVHKVARINFDDVHSRKLYSSYFAYAQSKLAQVMFTQSLARYCRVEHIPVTANCLHPGIVDTNLYKRVFWAPLVSGIFFKTPEEGAQTSLYAALSSDMEGVSGAYLEECTVSEPAPLSKDRALQDRLWKETWACLQPWLPSAASPLATQPFLRA